MDSPVLRVLTFALSLGGVIFLSDIVVRMDAYLDGKDYESLHKAEPI
jgi:hypothetical protein